MTKKTFHRWFIAVVAYFVALINISIIVGIADYSANRVIFSAFKDMIPLLISIPATWLAYCVQRRSAYLQQLRSLWSKLVEAIQLTIQYTYLETPSDKDYLDVLLKLSSSIDEVRGLFCNLGETEYDDGLYPFEPLKDIFNLMQKLSKKSFSSKEASKTRLKVSELWKDVRKELLKEFDREEPTFPHSHWVDIRKSRVYIEHDIPKTFT